MSKYHVDNYEYIYDLPYIQRAELCDILNQNNKWEELAGHCLQLTNSEIQKLKLEKNPTDELLTKWGHCNHKIYELFVHLSKMHHYEAMQILKNFVDSKLHVLLDNGEGNLQNIFRNGEHKKDSKIGTHNFNKNQKLNCNCPKVLIDNSTEEESEKILNKTVQEQLNELPSNSINFLTPMSSTFLKLPNIPFHELTAATDNWDKKNSLGAGGFAVVYKGIWKNTLVAIKKLEKSNSTCSYNETYEQRLEQSIKEIQILNSTPHENILPLYGYSQGGETPCLIYQCMINGSLFDRLHLKNGTQPLDWMQRKEIAKGIARGLHYLHTIHENPLIHGDIKSANILLDKNFEPKIGDFGFAKECSSDNSMKVDRIQGTAPYVAPEYFSSRKLSTKIDTYSYGIVLFELATSQQPAVKKLKFILREAIHNADEKSINKLMDKRAGEMNTNVFKHLIQIGKQCTNLRPEDRPEMSVVYEKFDSTL